MTDTKQDQQSLPLMSSSRIGRSVDRMAFQIAEDNRGEDPIVIVGLKDRGFAVAQKLAHRLKTLNETQVQLVHLPDPDQGFADTARADFPAQAPYLMIVDDVIFSGRTMFTAIGLCIRELSPDIIRTAVLIDRGHRTVPVEATFAGLTLPTKLGEHVHVVVEDSEPTGVILTKSS